MPPCPQVTSLLIGLLEIAIASLTLKATPLLLGFSAFISINDKPVPGPDLIHDQLRIEHLLKRMDQILRPCERWLWNEIELKQGLLYLKSRSTLNEKLDKPKSTLDSAMRDLFPDPEEEEIFAGPITPTSPILLELCAESCQLRVLFELVLSSSSYFVFLGGALSTPPHQEKTTIYLSPSLAQILKDIFSSKFFFDTHEKWEQFSSVIKTIDGEFYIKSIQKRYSEHCCTLLKSSLRSDDCLFEYCEKLIGINDEILLYLKQCDSHEGDPSEGLDVMVMTVSTSIICVYAYSLSVNELNCFSRRVFQQILTITSFCKEWATLFLIDMSLFLESHPVMTERDTEVSRLQTDMLGKLSQLRNIPVETLRDSLLCGLIDASFIFSALLNIILHLKQPTQIENRKQPYAEENILLELFGLLLGVAQEDLEDLYLNLSNVKRNLNGTQLSGCLSSWMILFPYMKLLCWRLLGTVSPSNDTEACINNFTNKLEVTFYSRSFDVCLGVLHLGECRFSENLFANIALGI